jgi:predicted GNAT family N-acyltransferase
LRQDRSKYPLPVLRLARLAVDHGARGQGLGRELLRFVLELALRMSHDYGCVGVVVDAQAEAVEFYSKYGFVRVEAIEGMSSTRPAPIVMFLSTRAISGGK